VTSVSGHSDLVLGISVNYQGNLIASTCRDKLMRIIDNRASTIVSEFPGHAGTKGSRITWLGNKPQLLSAGFGKASDRELLLWDSRSLSTPVFTLPVDQLSGLLTPYYDEDTGVVFVAGRGDGSIKMFELVDNELFHLTEYNSNLPQMGVAPLPKHSLDIRGCEIARFLKVSDNTVEPIQMTVPRTRMEFFQDDIFPPTRSPLPTYTSEEYVSGTVKEPTLVSLQPAGTTPLSQAPVVEKKGSSFFASNVVDNTPSKEQVMSKFWQQTLSFKEDEATVTNSAHEGDEDGEWA